MVTGLLAPDSTKHGGASPRPRPRLTPHPAHASSALALARMPMWACMCGGRAAVRRPSLPYINVRTVSIMIIIRLRGCAHFTPALIPCGHQTTHPWDESATLSGNPTSINTAVHACAGVWMCRCMVLVWSVAVQQISPVPRGGERMGGRSSQSSAIPCGRAPAGATMSAVSLSTYR